MAGGDRAVRFVTFILLQADRVTLTPTQVEQLAVFFRVAPGSIG